MSQHSSLKSGRKRKKHRSVLKRYERINTLKEKKEWTEEEDSVFGLQKVKTIRIKIKKEKAAAETPEGAEAAAGAAGTTPATGGAEAAKETKDAKEGAKKEAPKKEGKK